MTYSPKELQSLAQNIVLNKNILQEPLDKVIAAQFYLDNQSNIPTERKIRIEGIMSELSEKIIPILQKRLAIFLQSDIQASLHRNRHMNNYSGELVDLTAVTYLLNNLINNINPSSSFTVSVLESMTASARKLSNGDKVLDAVMVQFINDVGVFWGCDYGLYTSDLR